MMKVVTITITGADPGFFLGGGALFSCSTSTPINHIVFFLQNTSCIRKPQVISGGGVRTPCTLPLDPPLNNDDDDEDGNDRDDNDDNNTNHNHSNNFYILKESSLSHGDILCALSLASSQPLNIAQLVFIKQLCPQTRNLNYCFIFSRKGIF